MLFISSSYEVVPFAKGTEMGWKGNASSRRMNCRTYEVVPFAKGTEMIMVKPPPCTPSKLSPD